MAEDFILFASPWWVNLFFLLPFITYFLWKSKFHLSSETLILTGIFSSAFGFIEATVVVYLRAAVGLSGDNTAFAPQTALLSFPEHLFTLEVMREAAAIVVLVALACLAGKTRTERWAVYFWSFALWDILYYVSLYVLIGWPASLIAPDVLFLIPEPWYSQVWFPLLISSLLIVSVLMGRRKKR